MDYGADCWLEASGGIAGTGAFPGSPFSASLTALPKHKSSEFKQVLHVPGVKSITVWVDAQGRDCLAARRGVSIGFSEDQEIVVSDASFQELGRVAFKQVSWAASSNSLAVGDVTGDGVPEVFAGIAKSQGDAVLGFDLAGNLLFEHKGSAPTYGSMAIIESPAKPGAWDLIFVDFDDSRMPYMLLDVATGTRDQQAENAFYSVLSKPAFTFDIPMRTDWDGDGTMDFVFLAEDPATYGTTLNPYVKGKFLAPVPTGSFNFYPSGRVARFFDVSGKETVLLAHNDPIRPAVGGTSNPLAFLSPYKGNSLEWESLDGTISVKKDYAGNTASLGNDTLELADVTGDGIPEICAIVLDSKFVILDLAGNELLSEKYFGRVRSYSGLGSLVSGDFDGDGVEDLAFVYENGVFIPDLSALKGKAAKPSG